MEREREYEYKCESYEGMMRKHRVSLNGKALSSSRFRYRASLALSSALLFSLSFSLVNIALGIQWIAFFGALLSLIFQRNVVKQESVIIMPTLGVQLETVYGSGKVRRRFVPLNRVLAAVINESVTPTTCYYYLALLLKDNANKLALGFQELRPPLTILVPVWKDLCEALGKKRDKAR